MISGDKVRLKYRDKELELVECRSFFSRFKGFMLCRDINKALLFKRCNSIHTFFMLENIDVILCNEDNVILYYYKDMGPNRVILPKKGVTRVYEVPRLYFGEVMINEKLEVK